MTPSITANAATEINNNQETNIYPIFKIILLVLELIYVISLFSIINS